MKWWRNIAAVVVGLGLLYPAQLMAANPTSKSNNFGIVEDNIGIGSDVTSNSTSYSSGGSTLGDTAVGNSASTTYQAGSGFNTTDDPSLTFIVNTASVNLGTLSTSAKSTATATFNVTDYTSFGYTVTVIGTPPTYAGHALAPLLTDTASSAGTEQFGINTVLNTGVGANPVWVPGPNFSYGVAGDGLTGVYGTTRPYTVPDAWRFKTGETIASSPKTSGETDYTITFMANISSTTPPVTPGGSYSGSLILVATGQY